MAAASPERVRGDLERLVHRGADVREFSVGAARILARAVPFDGFCVLTLDPATLLPTGEVVENGLPQAAMARMADIEIQGGDLNSFAALARSSGPAASLSEATDGDLDRSLRHRELRRPNGFGDELRAVLATDASAWGGLTLLRAADRNDFTEADVSLVASVSSRLAEGLRRAMMFSALSSEGEDVAASAGLALVAADNTITLADAAAELWLTKLRGTGREDEVPPVVAAVASRARSIVDGSAEASAIARVRIRTPAGRWVLVRGSMLGDGEDAQVAVMIEPLPAHELAPLIAGAYSLTERERAVTQLVAQGLSTAEIAERVHLSPWTVQDHLKSIFEKLGVGTRGALVARIFFEHYAPRLSEGAPRGPNG
jgi:DNA-binding CsgD family transcriptional regulator